MGKGRKRGFVVETGLTVGGFGELRNWGFLCGMDALGNWDNSMIGDLNNYYPEARKNGMRHILQL